MPKGITIRLPDNVHKRLEEKAKNQDTKMTRIISGLIDDYLDDESFRSKKITLDFMVNWNSYIEPFKDRIMEWRKLTQDELRKTIESEALKSYYPTKVSRDKSTQEVTSRLRWDAVGLLNVLEGASYGVNSGTFDKEIIEAIPFETLAFNILLPFMAATEIVESKAVPWPQLYKFHENFLGLKYKPRLDSLKKRYLKEKEEILK